MHSDGIYKIDARVLGDFNYDQAVDATDIDALYAEVNAGTHNTFFDLSGDNLVTATDVDVLVREILGTEYGDANLDKGVSLLDLDILGQNYDQASGWAGGDFTGNGMVSLVDLDVLGRHYGGGNDSPTFLGATRGRHTALADEIIREQISCGCPSAELGIGT